MKRVSRQGLGISLFADWRYVGGDVAKGQLKPDFVLNQEAYQHATILLTGANMGCGSSREFAVWALQDFGIRVIIAPSFGAIFQTNCLRNGLLPVLLEEEMIEEIVAAITPEPHALQLEVNLAEQTVSTTEKVYRFAIEASYKQMLLDGLDAIDQTLRQSSEIEAFIAKDRKIRPWAYL